MKKAVFFVLITVLPYCIQAQSKFAVVIGNGNYTGISKLNNPVNDAADVGAALQSLGFQVELLTDADLSRMERALTQLKNRLSASKDSYGFFYYAGHGVQANGENYLIPVDANIQSETYLKTRALALQNVLDELNQAGNTLNVIVLDACRDNPFGWNRSGSRGLSVVSHQPAGSIIVYATTAGRTAVDGAGRNGLFTGQLLRNLTSPGVDVKEVFDRTGADVMRVSNNAQVPGVYSQFFGRAYLGSAPGPGPQPGPTQRGNASYDYNPSRSGLVILHPSLSFNTRVKITNLENGRSVEAVVAGRIPMSAERIAVISHEAGDAIGMNRTGMTLVEIQIQMNNE
jgi:hypothetical protein